MTPHPLPRRLRPPPGLGLRLFLGRQVAPDRNRVGSATGTREREGIWGHLESGGVGELGGMEEGLQGCRAGWNRVWEYLGAGFGRKWGGMEQDMGVHRGRMEQGMEDMGLGMRDRGT